MPDTHEMETRFFKALSDIFVGVPVEGQSGYINLMHIKSTYYTQGVFPRLQADINAACAPFHPDFREDLFNKLYNFFYRYFSESGSIYFRYTPLHENVYERVYSDDKDVMLFWKTHMLYYVKTDRLFQSLEVDADGAKVYFDVSTLQHKKANEKRDVVYEFGNVRDDGAIVLTVSYAEKGRKTKAEDILKAAKKAGAALSEDQLDRACRVFEKQAEVDYFINKDAGNFLRQQFGIWFYQYVFEPDQATGTQWTETRLQQLQAIKAIAFKIIDFIAQFEDELVKVWNKPKFVLNSHYVITLDRIAERDAVLLARLFEHPGMVAQVQEWLQLGMVGADFTPSTLQGENLGEGQSRYRYLPLDTRHFKEVEPDILALFDHLDDELDGWLIKSENYQALNTLQSRFRERVKCIYIDPPYNTGNDEFFYHDRFQDSTWLTMLDNRLELSRSFLSGDGILFASVDDKEMSRAIELLAMKWGKENHLATLIRRTKSGGGSAAGQFAVEHDYVISWGNRRDAIGKMYVPFDPEYAKRYAEIDEEGPFFWDTMERSSTQTKPYKIPAPDGTLLEGKWFISEVNFKNDLVKGHVRFLNKPDGSWSVQFKQRMPEGKKLRSLLIEKEFRSSQLGLEPFGLSAEFVFPKPVHLPYKLIQASTDDNHIVLDFFAGSGTTGHAVVNLNREDEDGGLRKYILVEMGEHFDTVLLPRIKKVVFSDQWKDGQSVEGGQGISHFCKVYQLEQYEDVLRRAHYEDAPLFTHGDPYSNYVFLRDLKMLDAVTLDKQANTATVHLDNLYDGIDLAETLANVLGQRIARLTRDAVTFEDGTTIDLTQPDFQYLKPLIWW